MKKLIYTITLLMLTSICFSADWTVIRDTNGYTRGTLTGTNPRLAVGTTTFATDMNLYVVGKAKITGLVQGTTAQFYELLVLFPKFLNFL